MLSKEKIAFLIRQRYRDIRKQGGDLETLYRELAYPYDFDGMDIYKAFDNDISDVVQEVLSPFFEKREKGLVKQQPEPLTGRNLESPQRIGVKEEESLPEEGTLTRNELIWIIEQSKLNMTEVATVLKTSRRILYYILKGERKVTKKMSQRIQEKMSLIFPKLAEMQERALKLSKSSDT